MSYLEPSVSFDPPSPSGWPWPLDAVQRWFESLWNHVWNAAWGAVQWVWSHIDWARSWLYNAVRAGWEWLAGYLYKAIKGFTDWVWGGLQWVGGRVWEGIHWLRARVDELGIWLAQRVEDTRVWLQKHIDKGFDLLGEFGIDPIGTLKRVVVNPVKGFLEDITKAIGDIFKDPLAALEAAITGIASAFWDLFKDPLKALKDAIDGIASTFWDFLKDPLAAIKDAIADIGKSVGESLKPVWEWFWGFAEEAAKTIAGIVTAVKEAVQPTIEPIGRGLLDSITAVMKPSSPEEETRRSVEELVETMRTRIVEEIKKAYASPTSPEEIITVAGSVAALLGMGIVSIKVMAMAADAAHPTKDIGFKDMATSMIAATGAGIAMASILRTPIDIGLLTPLEYAYNAMFTPKVPPVSDIITMMVREVFVPERFAELVQEYPPEATEFGAKHGYSEEWMRRYWAMHWILVPIGQLYDMYHRGIIDYATLERFVRYHDIEPMCRPWVIELAWELPGRIDMRWMYEWAVMKSYGDITGRKVEPFTPLPRATDEEVAMAEWLIADGIHPKIAPYVARAWIRNLLREEIMGALRSLGALVKEGYRTREEFLAWCREHGIPDRRAEYYIMRYEYEREQEEKDLLVKAWYDAFRKKKIDETQFRSALLDLGVQEWKIEALVKRVRALEKLPS